VYPLFRLPYPISLQNIPLNHPEYNPGPDVLEKMGENLDRGCPFKIALAELANPCNIRKVAIGVNRRKGLATRDGGQRVKVGVEDFEVWECICDIQGTSWVSSPNEVVRIRS